MLGGAVRDPAVASTLYTHAGWAGVVATGSGLALVSLTALVLRIRR
ncbi:hypothetical protein ACU4GD_32105 [Cupriavidus basilensis]